MSDTQVDLVFEGGGAKGVVFLGALEALAAGGLRPRRLVGTSAGAITAALVAAGFDLERLAQIIGERTADGHSRFSTFLDPPGPFDAAVVEDSVAVGLLSRISIVELLRRLITLPGFLGAALQSAGDLDRRLRTELVTDVLRLPVARTLFSFEERGGLYEGRRVLDWVREKLNESKIGRLGDLTFAQFHAKTQSDLTLVASDTVGNEMLVLNHRTAPQCPVAWAVRMSMSIPFLWQEVCWDAAWGPYRGRDITGHTIVDGGVLSNFPLWLFTTSEAVTAGLMEAAPPASRLMGLLIDEELPVPGSDVDGPKRVSSDQAVVSNLRTVQRVRRLIDTLTQAHDKGVIAGHPELICRLPAQGYGTTEFDMTDARRDALVAAGRAAMAAFLNAGG